MSDSTIHVCEACDGQPGSDSARDMGCICNRIDNGYGHCGHPYVVRLDCPIHGDEPTH